jgi:hypothetical protein
MLHDPVYHQDQKPDFIIKKPRKKSVLECRLKKKTNKVGFPTTAMLVNKK